LPLIVTVPSFCKVMLTSPTLIVTSSPASIRSFLALRRSSFAIEVARSLPTVAVSLPPMSVVRLPPTVSVAAPPTAVERLPPTTSRLENRRPGL